MRLARFAVAALLLLVPACGGSQVSEAAATRLQPQVQALREAAATGSQEAANRELAELRALVAELSATDELSQRGARRVLAAADRVEANLGLLADADATTTTTATTVPPTTTTTTPAPPEDEEEKGDDDKEEEEKKKEEEKKTEPDPTVVDTTTTTPGNDGGNNGNN